VTLQINPLIAAGVVVSTAATDAVYVMFNAAVTARRPAVAASWSSMWYLLAAFAMISYTGNPIYALFAAAGSWIGAYASVRWIGRSDRIREQASATSRSKM
jgi:hypothetical protein